jgi:integrase
MPRKQRTPWLGQEPNQNVWYIYWYDPNTGRVKRHSSGTFNRGEAETALGRFIIENAAASESSAIEPPERYLIVTALRWYLQERGAELASSEFAASAVDRLMDFFGPRATVSSVTPQVLKRYANERKRKVRRFKTKNGETVVASDKPISSATIRRELAVLSASFNHAIENGRLTSAPKVILPPQSPNKTRYLEREEVERLLEACHEPHLRLFVLLAINTGARKGALLELKWQQIDFANRLIYLNPEGREQTTKRRAIVPINDRLFDVLNKVRADIKQNAESRKKAGKPPLPPCDYVIAYQNAPLADIKGSFKRACIRADLAKVTPHTLRHTAGTLMALAGVDLFLIAKVLGHSVQKTTELYAHYRPDYLRQAVAVLG